MPILPSPLLLGYIFMKKTCYITIKDLIFRDLIVCTRTYTFVDIISRRFAKKKKECKFVFYDIYATLTFYPRRPFLVAARRDCDKLADAILHRLAISIFRVLYYVARHYED